MSVGNATTLAAVTLSRIQKYKGSDPDLANILQTLQDNLNAATAQVNYLTAQMAAMQKAAT